jgi:MraZ protein
MNFNFLGVYFYAIDSKNRLAIPSKFRSALDSQQELILTQGLEGCLNLYPLSSWAKLNEKMESIALNDKSEMRAFKRMLFSSAAEVSLDMDGRILIPQTLVEYAQLKREIAVVGGRDKIEIWAKSLWQEYQARHKTTFARHTANLEL